MPEHPGERRLMRLLATGLMVLWALAAIAVATAYRPGGPLDIVVAVACFLPVLIADAGLVWPATGLSRRHRTALVWVWIAAVLFVIPIIYGVVSTLAAGGRQSLVPSYEEAYAAVLALVPMAFFSVVGLVHRRRGTVPLERRSTLLSFALALLLTAVVSLAFVLVAVINDQALRRDEPTTSRFGPTDPDIEPPFCDEPTALGRYARVTIEASSSVDAVERGRARLVGRRDGVDESWSGAWAGPDGSGAEAYLRVGRQAWHNESTGDPLTPGRWQEVAPDPFSLAGTAALTMDGPVHAIASTPRGEIVAEDLGLNVLEGARARHCRTFIDGTTALEAFLPVRWLLYGSSHPADAIPRWRGTLDWWVFVDGELGMAALEVSGSRAETDWDTGGVRAVLEARLEATRRDTPVDVTVPPAATDAPGLPAAVGATPTPAHPTPRPTLESETP